MEQQGSADELLADWSLAPEDLALPRTQASGVPDQWGETPELIRELVPISEDVDVIDIIAVRDVRWAR